MKRLLQFGGMVVASLLTAISCQNEELVSEIQSGNYTLNVSSFVGSRTHVDQDGTVKWSKGDKLYVYGQGVSGVLTLNENDADKTNGQFSGFVFGNPQNLQWAVFGDDVKFTNDGAQFTISEVTDPNSNSPMVGEIGSGSVQMEHLCGMIRLTINNLPQNAVVTLDGTGIAGTAKVKNGKITEITPDNSITLKTVEGSDNVFEVPVFAEKDQKEYKDFTLSINGVRYPFKAPVKVKSVYASEVAEFNCVVANGVVTAISQFVETEEALANALQATGSVEIQLADDMEFDHDLTVGESTEATINLNGNTLNASGITVNGKLTIEGAGKVLGDITLDSNASLEILGGTYTQDISQYVPSGYASISHSVNGNTVYIAFEGEQSKVVGGAASTEELQNVLKGVTEDKNIIVLAGDVTVVDAWDNRFTGGKMSKPIVMEGAGNTLKFANTVYDAGNYMSAFRFEVPATVKNMVFDLSEAQSGLGSRVRAISAKDDLTVDNCVFIGNPSLTNDRGIIYGEGNSETYTGIINISNCTFVNWKRGISDNENRTDAKGVTVENCVFNNSAVYLSAYSAVNFISNKMDNSVLNIITNSKSITAKVKVMDNVLDDSQSNVIANFVVENVECQEGVTIK